MIAKYNQIQLNHLATKEDVANLRTELHSELSKVYNELGNIRETMHKAIGNISWRVAAFMIAQSALIAALFKILQ